MTPDGWGPDGWGEVKRIFQAALELPAAERGAFLQAECAGNDELRREVDSLLESEESSGDFLADSASSYVPDALDEVADTNIGRRIGPYQIVREIGAGGMGVVYLAERVDEFRQKVALKLMQRGVGSRVVIARFRHERQILAGLDHPNIARLFDGGATDDGRPYFVMEFVDGVPIDVYCAGRVSIPQALRLFLSVCAAVQYAHQNLVVHRDLKPGNILVTEDGTPKLLDFGIAKLVRQESAEESAGLTQVGTRLMTPEFASPEQVRALPVAAASDVYSLGVILYLLLTGKLPYTFESGSLVEVERIVTTKEPPRPSAAAPRLARYLEGDLDVMVLKALEKDPQRRYGSVEQFAGDLWRHLRGLPITARPQTWSYLARRFVSRNRVPVAAAALVVLSLAGGLVGTAWQWSVASAERNRAETNFNDVRRLTQRFLFEFHDQIKELPGSTKARNLVVQTASDYLSRLERQARGDAALARDVAEAYLRLGDVQGNPYERNSGDTAAAMASYKKSLAIGEDLVRGNPKDTQGRLYLARAHRSLGELIPQTGDIADAVPHFRAAISAVEGASDAESRKELARGYEMLGGVLGQPGLGNLSDAAAAHTAYEKALAIHQQVGNRRGAAVLGMKLGDLDLDRGEPAAALARYEAAAPVFRALSAANRFSSSARREAGLIESKLASAYEALDRTGEALERYKVANEIALGLMAADPSNQQARMGYAVSLKNQADLEFRLGHSQAALGLYRLVLGIVGPMSKAEPDNLMLRSRYADMLINVAYMVAQGGPQDEARRLYVEGFGILKQLADRPGATAEDLNSYVEALVDCQVPALINGPEAVAYAKRAVEMTQGSVPRYLDRLARAWFAAGNPREAAAEEEKALAVMPAGSPERKAAEDRLKRYRAAR